jgi:hypothetical protein
MIRRETWIVLALFLIALAGLLLWQRYGSPAEEEAESTETVEQKPLFDLEFAKLQSVRLQRRNEAVEFERDDAGAWQIVSPEQDQPTDSESLESTLSQLETVTGEPMENAPEMAAMGLDQPAYRLLLTMEDGRQQTASVGKETPTGGSYYVLSSDGSVYLVSSYLLDPILGLIDALPLQSTPTPADVYPSPEVTPGLEPTENIPAGTP